MGDVLKKFGRYFLLDQMAQGGMAEIYRARLATLEGAGRLLVIKRIQSGFGTNSEFLQMFKSEIKVTMGFSHPNIVQLYDFGEEKGQPFIAMEFIDGKNLRQFISRFNELKNDVPVELAVYIIGQAAAGLFYAHSFKDKLTGKPLNIVHRDISPQNILISYEGNVKVIDFGIAKAATNGEATRVGVIKGKPSYLSPEQISGETLDGRSDIFSLGTVLWEVLTGKKLFSGENDLSVLKLIESSQSHVKPPSTLNPNIPKELDQIVMKALSKQPEKRYQTAEEFQRALHKFLYSFQPEFNPGDLGYFAKDIFSDDIVQDRKRVQRLNESAEKLLVSPKQDEDPKQKQSSGTGARDRRDETTIADFASKKTEVSASDIKTISRGANTEIRPLHSAVGQPSQNVSSSHNGFTKNLETSSIEGWNRMRDRMRSPNGSRTNKASMERVGSLFWAAAICAGLIVFAPDLGFRIPYVSDIIDSVLGTTVSQLVVNGSDRNVVVSINEKIVSNTLPVTLSRVPAGKTIHLLVTGPGGIFEQNLTLKKGEKRVVAVALSQDPQKPSYLRNLAGTPEEHPDPKAPLALVAGKTASLHLSISPSGGSPAISVSGMAVSKDNPIIVVPVGQTLELVVDRAGYRRLRRQFYIDPRQLNGATDYGMDVQLERLHFGKLSIHTTPSAEAIIDIDGEKKKMRTPFELQQIPVGHYTIRLVNDILGMEKTVSVSVEEGKVVDLHEHLPVKE